MTDYTQFTRGQNMFVRRPETSFSGRVVESRPGWVRVFGTGSIVDTFFDEWFPISSQKQSVHLAA